MSVGGPGALVGAVIAKASGVTEGVNLGNQAITGGKLPLVLKAVGVKLVDQVVVEEWVRVLLEHYPALVAGSIDSQSLKTGSLGLKEIRLDGGKQIKGHKRHLRVDTLGFVMMGVVTAANTSDPQGADTHFSDILLI
jgi:hypothetical protein